MYLEIVTPDKKVFEGEVFTAKFPGSKGEFQVLNEHAPLISSLERGNLTYRDDEGDHIMTIDGGVVEVFNDKIIVLAEKVLD